MTDSVRAKPVLERYSTSYAKKALQMRTASQNKQQIAWATKRVAAVTDEELAMLAELVIPDV